MIKEGERKKKERKSETFTQFDVVHILLPKAVFKTFVR